MNDRQPEELAPYIIGETPALELNMPIIMSYDGSNASHTENSMISDRKLLTTKKERSEPEVIGKSQFAVQNADGSDNIMSAESPADSKAQINGPKEDEQL